MLTVLDLCFLCEMYTYKLMMFARISYIMIIIKLLKQTTTSLEYLLVAYSIQMLYSSSLYAQTLH